MKLQSTAKDVLPLTDSTVILLDLLISQAPCENQYKNLTNPICLRTYQSFSRIKMGNEKEEKQIQKYFKQTPFSLITQSNLLRIDAK